MIDHSMGYHNCVKPISVTYRSGTRPVLSGVTVVGTVHRRSTAASYMMDMTDVMD